MQIVVKKKVGSAVFEVTIEEKEDKDTMAKAILFTELDYCTMCEGNKIIWKTNKATTDQGTFTYIKRKCLGCSAESTMGEYKTGGYFWKKWEKYEPKNGDEPKEPEIPTVNQEDVFGE